MGEEPFVKHKRVHGYFVNYSWMCHLKNAIHGVKSLKTMTELQIGLNFLTI